MEKTHATITLETTVNDIVALEPAALSLLNDFGIDTCCGGGCSLREAALDAGVSPEQVLETLRRAAAQS